MDDKRWAEWLATWETGSLARLLEARPDLLSGRPPDDLADLARRLIHPRSLLAAAERLSLPERQAWDAVRALGARRRRADLHELLRGPSAAVEAALAGLSSRALVLPDGDRLVVPSSVDELTPPLGLPGRPAGAVWREATLSTLQRALRAWGERPPRRKADAVELLVRVVTDPERVREQVAPAPPAIRAALSRWAAPSAGGDDDGFDDLLPAPARWIDSWADPRTYEDEQAAWRWAIERGLAAGSMYGWGPGVLPSEVALALRGPDYRAPFDPVPPEVAALPVAPEVVASAAAGAAGHLLDVTTAALEELEREALETLAGGGIGVRSLKRLARRLGVDEAMVRLVIELAEDLGLLTEGFRGVGPSDEADAWRDADPAAQVAALLEAWWRHPGTPTRARDDDGRSVPALSAHGVCHGCLESRRALLAEAARTGPDRAGRPEDLAAAALWRQAGLHTAPGESAPLDTVWRELHLVGAVGAGAVSPLGAALLAEDEEGLTSWLGTVLPARVDSARFGSDLTVLASGRPSPSLARLLDSCADRESAGNAVTWRFRPESVRRAYDTGRTGDELLADLRALTDRELPQPLIHLLRDVARRHGSLRVHPAASVVTGVDAAIVAEVLTDRRLARLELRTVGPTALISGRPLDETLAALRSAGYFPAADEAGTPPREDPRALLDPLVPPRPLRPVPRRRPGSAELAEKLRAAGAAPASAREPADPVTDLLTNAAPQLAPGEVALLADALRTVGRLGIVYRAASGAVTRRVIRAPLLAGHVLEAWCELRDDERGFSLTGIQEVFPPP